MVIVNALIGIFSGLGLFFVLEDFFKIPYKNTIKSVTAYTRIRNRNHAGRFSELLDDLSIKISKLIHLDDYKKDQMCVELESARIAETPELFISKNIVKSLVVLLLIVPVALVFPIGVPVVLIGAVFVFLSSMNKISEQMEKKRKQIEYELPKFVSFISKTIVHNRDILSLLENYLDNAGEEFGKELLITVADMKSGNYESAITRMETRIGSSMLSDVARGLVSVLRGDDTITYWENLEIKFSDYQRQLLKQKALKIPSKVRRLSFVLLICFMSFYIVILGVAIIDGIGVMF